MILISSAHVVVPAGTAKHSCFALGDG
jgi:hypothetical protein